MTPTTFDPKETVTVTISRQAAEMLAQVVLGCMTATGAHQLVKGMSDQAAEEVRTQYRSAVLVDGCAHVARVEIARLKGELP